MLLRSSKKPSLLWRFLACLLVAATFSLATGFGLEGFARPARFDVVDKAAAIGKNVVKPLKYIPVLFALDTKTLPRTSIPSLFLSRSDVKQNLRTWPVVAGNLTRSPPFLVSP